MANGHNKSLVNGHINGANSTAEPRALNIAIIGAGIGGLTAAIGLRKNGHKVSVGSHLLTENKTPSDDTSSYTNNRNSPAKQVQPST